MIERHVDYLAGTAPFNEHDFILRKDEAIVPIRFYRRGYRDKHGICYYFGTGKNLKCYVVETGAALERQRQGGKSDAQILDEFLTAGGKLSRLDLAITEWIEAELVLLEDVEKWYANGLIESSLVAGGLKEISSLSEDSSRICETIYIGELSKRGKRGIFRAYDKGLEMSLSPEIATRIEIEIKREKAHNTAKRIAKSNDIAGNFRSHFNVRSDDFERIMQAPVAERFRGQAKYKVEESEKMDKRWDWLLNQVAPSLQEAIEFDRKNGRGDVRMMAFLAQCQLGREMRQVAQYLADVKYRDMLERNELVERSRSEKE